MMMGSRSSSMRSTGGSLVGLSTNDDFAVGLLHFVDDGRRGGDQLDLVFALEPLLHDVHVQQAEEADAETEAERGGHFGLVVQRRIVEPQLGQRIAELVVVVGDDREHAGEHARLHLLEARQRLGRPACIRA